MSKFDKLPLYGGVDFYFPDEQNYNQKNENQSGEITLNWKQFERFYSQNMVLFSVLQFAILLFMLVKIYKK